MVLGYLDDTGEFAAVEPRFDLDSYRILVSYIKRKASDIKITPYQHNYA